MMKNSARDLTTVPENLKPYKPKKGEKYMNPQQLDHFRGMLNNWKDQLLLEADRTIHHMQSDTRSFPDSTDRATHEAEFRVELRTRDRERKLLKKINHALASIDHDGYGYCEECGVEIGLSRLEVRLTADLCIDCKTLEESKEKHLHG